MEGMGGMEGLGGMGGMGEDGGYNGLGKSKRIFPTSYLTNESQTSQNLEGVAVVLETWAIFLTWERMTMM